MVSERVKSFCDWLETVPPSPPFHTHPDFADFKDLTQAEFGEAQAEMRKRGEAFLAEADALESEGRQRRIGRSGLKAVK